MDYRNKYDGLLENIKQYSSGAVAFSGGVDSTLLCKAAVDALGDKAMAFTVFSPFIPDREKQLSKKMAETIGIAHTVINLEAMDQIVLNNPVDRCYHCKRSVFSRITADAQLAGMEYIFDGSNVDDLKDYRPGMKALEELSVRSPLRDSGLTKDDIRGISKMLGLE
ncbi:MAG: asparagine synthase-related protein, partial [Spirochaetales bacterium]|nr:asparagine synthase-related protein [Spirochaetales bacterium]